MVGRHKKGLLKRCVICGKPISPGDRSFRITQGKLEEGSGFKEGKEFGLAHEVCFHKDFPSPEAALKHIQGLSTS